MKSQASARECLVWLVMFCVLSLVATYCNQWSLQASSGVNDFWLPRERSGSSRKRVYAPKVKLPWYFLPQSKIKNVTLPAPYLPSWVSLTTNSTKWTFKELRMEAKSRNTSIKAEKWRRMHSKKALAIERLALRDDQFVSIQISHENRTIPKCFPAYYESIEDSQTQSCTTDNSRT